MSNFSLLSLRYSCLVLMLCLFSGISYGQVYVDSSATGANDGTTWTDAYLYLQDALDDACMNAPVEIWVAGGTYYPDDGNNVTSGDREATFQLCNEVAIYGGFSGGENLLMERDWGTNVTILSGDINQSGALDNNSYTVVYSLNANNSAELNGFTITMGNANSLSGSSNRGGGMHNYLSSPTVTNCIFSDNYAWRAGGMYNDFYSSPTVTYCTFTRNEAGLFAGGMYNDSGSTTVTNCTFIGNSADYGGGMYNNSAYTTVTNCTFSGNSGVDFGGGMFNSSGYTTVINCIFSDNSSVEGGGMYNFFDSTTVTNCTFSENAAVDFGGGMYNYESSSTVTNCIIWGNGSSNIFNFGGIQTINYSLIQETDCPPNATCNSVIFNQDPLFADPAANNYQLTSCSPAINGGNPDTMGLNLPDTDLADNPRIVNDTIDMGSYEQQGLPCGPECPEGSVVHVKEGGTGNQDGSSWDDAISFVQDALEMACGCSNIQEIWVATGTYYPDNGGNVTSGDREATFQLCNGVAIYGGFVGTETMLSERDWEANVTILSGDINGSMNLTDNSYTVVTGSGTDNTAILDGFTITLGNADGDPGADGYGGGMYNFEGSPTVTNCTFFGNSAIRGGGMYNLDSSPSLTNCIFSGNSVVGGLGLGGAIYHWDNNGTSTMSLKGCLFFDNTASYNGGALFSPLLGGSSQVVNCTFSGNTAGNEGGAIRVVDGNLVVVNSIKRANQASGSMTSTSASISRGGSSVSVAHSLIANSGGSGSWNTTIGTDGGNNIDVDPLFVDPDMDDYSLQLSSPAINAGTQVGVILPAEDLAGNPRVSYGEVDMGAYEFLCGTECPVTNVNTGELYINIQSAINEATADDKIRMGVGTNNGDVDATAAVVTLVPGESPGCLTIMGNFTLDAMDIFEAEIDGTTACTEYDQVHVSGTATLGDANLNIVLGFAPAIGNQFNIITSDNPIVGQFSQGLSAVGTFGGTDYLFGIDYSGNQVTLTNCDGGVTNVTQSKEYCSIQGAIADANPSDEITVAPGTYNETILIDVPGLTLTGAPGAVIDGGDASVVVSIEANNVTIDGVTVQNGGMDPMADALIRLDGVTGVTINNTVIQDGAIGVAVLEGNGNVVTNNNIDDVVMGVVLQSTTGNFVGVDDMGVAGANTITIPNSGMVFLDNGRGVALTIASDNAVENNNITSVRYGIQIAEESDNNIVRDNNITAEKNGVVILGVDGGATYSGQNNLIEANIIDVTTPPSPGNQQYGIKLDDDANNTIIRENSIGHVAAGGIWATNVQNLSILNNLISVAETGVFLDVNVTGVNVINENSITGQNNWAVRNDVNPEVDATCNWWGTADETQIESSISGDVTFKLFLTSGGNSGSAAPGFSPTGVCDGGGSYVSGTVRMAADVSQTIEDVAVQVSGDATDQALTLADGTFELILVNEGNYTLTPEKNTTIATPGELNTFGVNSDDLNRLINYLNGTELMTEYQLIAGDVRSTDFVGTADRVVMHFALLGNTNALNFWNTDSYFFVDADYTFANPNLPWGYPNQLNYTNLNQDIMGADFVGVKKGDVVNASGWRQSGELSLLIEDLNLTERTQIEVPVRFSDFNRVTSFQMALEFDHSQLTFAGVEVGEALNGFDETDIGLFGIDEGIIRVVWAEGGTAGANLNEEEVVFTLVFDVESGAEAYLSDYFNLAVNDLHALGFKSGGTECPMDIEFTDEVISSTENHELHAVDFKATASPNPFSEEATIRLNMPASGTLHMEIYSMEGRQILSVQHHITSGASEIKLGSQQVDQPGLYFIHLRTDTATKVLKLIRTGN